MREECWLGWTLIALGLALAAIAVEINDDPNADFGKTVMFSLVAALFVAFAARLYWPVLRPAQPATPTAAAG
jgi:hypothetical protein